MRQHHRNVFWGSHVPVCEPHSGGFSLGDMRPFHCHKPLALGAQDPQVGWIQASALNGHLHLGAGVSLTLFQAREPRAPPPTRPPRPLCLHLWAADLTFALFQCHHAVSPGLLPCHASLLILSPFSTTREAGTPLLSCHPLPPPPSFSRISHSP